MLAIEVESLKKEERNGFVEDQKRIRVAKIRNGYVLGDKSIIFITKGIIEVYRYTRRLTEEEEKILKNKLRENKKEEIEKNKNEFGLQGGQEIRIIDGEVYVDDMLTVEIKDEDVFLNLVCESQNQKK